MSDVSISIDGLPPVTVTEFAVFASGKRMVRIESWPDAAGDGRRKVLSGRQVPITLLRDGKPYLRGIGKLDSASESSNRPGAPTKLICDIRIREVGSPSD